MIGTCLNFAECGGTKLLARGYCGPCYNRLKKRGTLKRAYVVNTGACSVEGCTARSFAKNLCQHHYNQADDPLKRAWKNLRSRYPGQFPAAWSRFEAFVADLPAKPEGQHQLRRVRGDEPWSASNMHWLALNIRKLDDPDRVYHSEYSKAWSDQEKYGVSQDRRAAMLADQDGKCAICRKPESAVNPRHPERKPRRLNIDHDHTTGAVRGLLCVRCNSMIGRRGANDSIDLLRSAIAYLEAHAAKPKPPA